MRDKRSQVNGGVHLHETCPYNNQQTYHPQGRKAWALAETPENTACNSKGVDDHNGKKQRLENLFAEPEGHLDSVKTIIEEGIPHGSRGSAGPPAQTV